MKIKLITLITFLTLTLFSSSATAATFSDVPNDHWAKGTIERAVNQGIIKGYPGNRFAPEEHVSVAAFFTMLSRSYQVPITPNNKKVEHWADPIYEAIEKYQYPYSKFQQKYKNRWESKFLYRDRPITRTEVAEIIAGADGVNYRGDFAIHYILSQGYASGKLNGQTSILSYHGKSFLTRAEAVAFIEKLKTNGLKELQVRPQQPSDPKKLPPLPDNQFPDPKEGVLHEVLMNYPGYYVEPLHPNVNSMFRAIQREIIPAEKNGDDAKLELIILFEDLTEFGDDFHGFKNEEDVRLGGLSSIVISDFENDNAVLIAIDTFRQFDIEPPPRFHEIIKEVMTSKQKKVVPFNGGQFMIVYQGSQLTISLQKK
ncbi:S-layer homology domain-containing protein [Brevibacillus porteri]|uniref:S-layer homology domain-containing protein n=1 Tax=Brevibacillus porteri TaxID=2126350 RepID=UPI003D1D222E